MRCNKLMLRIHNKLCPLQGNVWCQVWSNFSFRSNQTESKIPPENIQGPIKNISPTFSPCVGQGSRSIYADFEKEFFKSTVFLNGFFKKDLRHQHSLEVS